MQVLRRLRMRIARQIVCKKLAEIAAIRLRRAIIVSLCQRRRRFCLGKAGKCANCERRAASAVPALPPPTMM
jgi:hypothetical protein